MEREKLITAEEAQSILDVIETMSRVAAQMGLTTLLMGGDEPSLMDAIPGLARTVKALHAEVTALRDQLKSMTTDRNDWRTLAYEAQAKNHERVAIIEGRTTPPTDEEIDAHWRAGGAWLVEHRVIRSANEAKRVAAQCRDVGVPWVALNNRGLPCAWPVVLQ